MTAEEVEVVITDPQELLRRECQGIMGRLFGHKLDKVQEFNFLFFKTETLVCKRCGWKPLQVTK